MSWNHSSSVQYSVVGSWEPITGAVSISSPSIPWLGTSQTYPSYLFNFSIFFYSYEYLIDCKSYTPRGYPLEEENEESLPTHVIAIIAVLVGLLAVAVVFLIFFIIRKRRIHEKKAVPAFPWEDEPLMRQSVFNIKTELSLSESQSTSMQFHYLLLINDF